MPRSEGSPGELVRQMVYFQLAREGSLKDMHTDRAIADAATPAVSASASRLQERLDPLWVPVRPQLVRIPTVRSPASVPLDLEPREKVALLLESLERNVMRLVLDRDAGIGGGERVERDVGRLEAEGAEGEQLRLWEIYRGRRKGP